MQWLIQNFKKSQIAIYIIYVLLKNSKKIANFQRWYEWNYDYNMIKKWKNFAILRK